MIFQCILYLCCQFRYIVFVAVPNKGNLVSIMGLLVPNMGEQYLLLIIMLGVVTFIIMSPAQWCKSHIHVGNAEQCMLAFILLHIVHCVFIYVPCSTMLDQYIHWQCRAVRACIHLSIVIELHQLLCTIPSCNICAYCKCISLVVQLAA